MSSSRRPWPRILVAPLPFHLYGTMGLLDMLADLLELAAEQDLDGQSGLGKEVAVGPVRLALERQPPLAGGEPEAELVRGPAADLLPVMPGPA